MKTTELHKKNDINLMAVDKLQLVKKWCSKNQVILFFTVILVGMAIVAFADDTRSEKKRVDVGSAEHIDIWYGTLRNKTGKEFHGEYYGGTRDKLRTGICRAEFTPIPGISGIANIVPFYIPDISIELKDIHEFSEIRFWNEINAVKNREEGNVIFYIHGYNIGFEKSCRRAAMFLYNVRVNSQFGPHIYRHKFFVSS